MTVRALDENGDIVTSGVQFLTEREEIAQTISTRLKLFAEEYFRDISEGTPLYQIILPKNTTLAIKDSFIKARIAETDGVVNLLSYNADYDINLRKYSIQAEVLTSFGQVQLTQNGVV
jgi:hypothetical protein